MNSTKRSLSFILGLTCAALAAQVQVDWTYTADHPYDMGFAMSALELPDGSFMVTNTYSTGASFGSVTGLLQISSGGTTLEENVLESSEYHLGGNLLFPHPSGFGHQLITAAFAKQPGQRSGFKHYHIGPDLNVMNERTILYPHPVLSSTGWWDVTAAINGELLLVAGMFVGDAYVPTHLWLQRISANGDSLASRVYASEPGPGEVYTNSVTSSASVGDRVWVSFRAVRPLGPDGFSKCLLFDGALELVPDTGFALPYPFSSQSPVDSSQTAGGLAVSPSSDIYLLEARRVSNVFAPNDPSPIRAVIAKYSPQGELQRQYQHVPNDRDTGSSRRPVVLSDGSVVFAYNYGFTIPEAFQGPTSVHLLRFDLELNLLDEFVMDGELELAQYSVRDVVPTSDGGVLLLGGVSYSTAPARYSPWVVKLSGVIASVPEELGYLRPELRSYPNPGTGTLELVLTGRAQSTSHVVVADILGRTIAKTVLQNDHATLDASSWKAGMYLCVVLDDAGNSISQAIWIKH